MAELTQEYFAEQLKAQTTELKTYVKEQTDELASIIVNASLEDRKLLEEKLDVRVRVKKLEKNIQEIRGALHLPMS